MPEIKTAPPETCTCSFCGKEKTTGIFGNHERTAFICRECIEHIGAFVEQIEYLNDLDQSQMTPQ